MMAVMRRAEAVLQALIMMRSSIRLSLISPHPDCIIKTSSSRTSVNYNNVPDSPIVTAVSWLEYFDTTQSAIEMPSFFATEAAKSRCEFPVNSLMVLFICIWARYLLLIFERKMCTRDSAQKVIIENYLS